MHRHRHRRRAARQLVRPARGSVTIGFTAGKGATNSAPTAFTLDGGACAPGSALRWKGRDASSAVCGAVVAGPTRRSRISTQPRGGAAHRRSPAPLRGAAEP
ncbi:hypothetical protein [Streptomyces sp. 5-10]|uniref:hypothetical protein n=1 Tax=Streptomyces sp. 5-10 TaxID=878925 RepID=UPI00168C0A65|nr:hypothetical protein [Streptomyces sp. 5-10]MBD3004031.1 hypothetical protein [Streptomyces sp. 5-10]